MPIGPARMPLFDHLGELRRRLTIVVVSVFAAAIVLYFATPVVLDILEDPIRSFVPDGKFYITTTLGGFGLRFSLAIKMAVVMCTPMIIWQILAFFLPALRPNERKWVVPTVLASTVLFFLGAIFCYFIIIPAGFEWLIGETSAVATALPDLENYVNMELLFMIDRRSRPCGSFVLTPITFQKPGHEPADHGDGLQRSHRGCDAVAEAEDFLVIDLVHILVPDRIQHVLSVLGDLVEQICLQILIALVHLKLLSAERAVLDVLDVGVRRHVGADTVAARAVDRDV